MNICVVHSRMLGGEVERVVTTLARGLSRRGHRVSIVSRSGGRFDGPAFDEPAEETFRRFTIEGLAERRPGWIIRASHGLGRVLREIHPDVINVHGFSAVPIANLARRHLGLSAPIGFTLHSPERHWTYPLMGRALPLLVEDVSAVCSETRRQLRRHGYPPHLGEVIYKGIDEALLRPPAEVESRPLISEEGMIKLGVSSRLIQSKGIQTLLGALARLRARGTDRFVLDISGSGPYREALEKRCGRLKLGDRVRFIGRSHVPAFLDDIDILVCPNDTASFPMRILEAFARGTLVLATGVGGIPEAVWEGRTGFLVPPRDEERLARALERILSAHERIGEIRVEARRQVERRFLATHMIRNYEDWLARLVAMTI